MRDWLAKFKISCALDRDGQMPARRECHRSDGLQQFMRQTTALEAALKASVPKPTAPTALHGQIMSALRSSQAAANPNEESAPSDVSGLLTKWVGAPALV